MDGGRRAVSPLAHVMIRASAGSGKTHELTSRYAALLARGVPPERIVALTFTRKAAGEFFDRILQRLADAAVDPRAAAELDRGIGVAASERDYGRMLRAVIAAMPRLRLGTLDGFFARVVRTFALELGLTGDFDLLDEHAARLERRRVLRQLFVPAGEGVGEAQREFIEAFKRATFGVDEKRLAARLDAFLDEHQEIFLAASVEALWGDAARIWPGGNLWLEAETGAAAALAVLRRWVAHAAIDERQRRRWDEFCLAVETWSPGAPLPDPLKYVLKKALDELPDLSAGRGVLEFDRRPQEPAPEAARALARIALGIAAGELACRLTVTRGIHAVLREYEARYHDAVRRGGRLTFADVQRLLEPVRLASGDGGAEAGRLSIDYRLDGRIDHWLLDEFQDTSYGQWSILRNLVDEVVQDTSGRRTFFCVGDVKQAIFAWREGDPRLFGEILERYNAAAPGTIVEERRDRSWRSGPAPIGLVNAVFGAPVALRTLFPGEAAERWIAEWQPHETAWPNRRGQAALLLAEDKTGRWRVVLDLLRELAPTRRGLTCAVLVQRNRTASEIADFLRAEGGLPVLTESDLHVCTDTPLGAALLALVRAAAHPGDRLAGRLVRMGPLGPALDAAGLGEADALALRLLDALQNDGFARTLEGWIERVEPALPTGDRFNRERARQLVSAAEAFDATGSRDPDEFEAFMRAYAVREAEGAGVIRLMTIHKAKGLDFDVTILPDLEGQTLLRRRDGLGVQKARDRSVEWVLDLPPRMFCERDPVLRDHLREAEASACYERLSLLYVALTRAKRGLYLVTEPVGDSRSSNFSRLLAEALGQDPRPVRIGSLNLPGTWSGGDADWLSEFPVEGVKAAPAKEPEAGSAPEAPGSGSPIGVGGRAAAARMPNLRPADFGRGPVTAARLFQRDAREDAAFGAEVHRLLAEVGWAEPRGTEAWARKWVGTGAAGQEAADCLAAEALQAVWRQPSAVAELWRERAFEAVIDGAWVSGVFDRVVLEHDAKGRPARATVFDFKTDRIAAGLPPADLQRLAARHGEQLALYRRAVQALTGLPDGAVTAEVVFTRARARVPIR